MAAGALRSTERLSGAVQRKAPVPVLTPFEWSVLRATLEIPFGETRTYGWVAKRIGRPKAVRAVGSALRKNPWPITIPCHRVIKSDGTLGKYAGKDDGRKRKLIELERSLKTFFEISYG
ncbi:MAG: MGMT family protein [Candidatus Omnitrophica bacterium]|nr:MGMT family protein [Candidatus Omnitrophota bacterium]